MNNTRRRILREASGVLGNAYDMISTVLRQETYAMNNIPENLQESERFSKMEDCTDFMEDALQSIREAQSSLNDALS